MSCLKYIEFSVERLVGEAVAKSPFELRVARAEDVAAEAAVVPPGLVTHRLPDGVRTNVFFYRSAIKSHNDAIMMP